MGCKLILHCLDLHINLYFCNIQKHQDWLREHRKPKARKIQPNNSYYELANLWHTRKDISLKQKPSNKNDYLENETISKVSNQTDVIVLKPTIILINGTKGNEVSAPNLIPETTTTLATTLPTESSNILTTKQTPSIVEVFSSPNPMRVMTTKKLKKKVYPYPRWDKWSSWSECSRSCGGGVMYQMRKCINR